jgi:hypothetical protein
MYGLGHELPTLAVPGDRQDPADSVEKLVAEAAVVIAILSKHAS